MARTKGSAAINKYSMKINRTERIEKLCLSRAEHRRIDAWLAKNYYMPLKKKVVSEDVKI